MKQFFACLIFLLTFSVHANYCTSYSFKLGLRQFENIKSMALDSATKLKKNETTISQLAFIYRYKDSPEELQQIIAVANSQKQSFDSYMLSVQIAKATCFNQQNNLQEDRKSCMEEVQRWNRISEDCEKDEDRENGQVADNNYNSLLGICNMIYQMEAKYKMMETELNKEFQFLEYVKGQCANP